MRYWIVVMAGFLGSVSVYAEGGSDLNCKSLDGRYKFTISSSGPSTFNEFKVWVSGRLSHSYLDLGEDSETDTPANRKQTLDDLGYLTDAQIKKYMSTPGATIEFPDLGYTESQKFTRIDQKTLEGAMKISNYAGDEIAGFEVTESLVKNTGRGGITYLNYRAQGLFSMPSLKLVKKAMTCTGTAASD